MELRVFSLKELSNYDGQEGRPAYVAYRGIVYDVSQSYSWRNGNHYLLHSAGRDLSHDLQYAPHGEDLLMQFPIMGRLL